MRVIKCVGILTLRPDYRAFLTGVFVGLSCEVERSTSEAKMKQDCDAALEQIEGKPYADVLYGCRTILRYGVAFYRKSALVKKG